MKGFVFAQGREIAIRFFTTGAFSELEKEHELIYVALKTGQKKVDDGLAEALQNVGGRVVWMPFHEGRFQKWNELFDISCLLHKDRSPSFKVRSEQVAKVGPRRSARFCLIVASGTYRQYRDAVERKMGVHPELHDLIMKERPDFFILPSALLDLLTDDVLHAADLLKIPTLMLVAGWDNLSSKGSIYHQPTMMGVWGEQSRQHAIDVQSTPAERIEIAGAPHYEQYRTPEGFDRHSARAALGMPDDEGKLVLFAGTFREFDETQVLKDFDAAIDSGRFGNVHVIYRPHPLRISRRHEVDFFSLSWKHISMDEEMAKSYRRTKMPKAGGAEVDDISTRLQRLIGLYSSVDLVISPMSSILLEALLFGVPTMAVTFGDGKHEWSIDKVSQMMHFRDLYDIPDVVICKNQGDFISDFAALAGKAGDVGVSDSLRESAKFFVYRDNASYARRACDMVKKMLANAGVAPDYSIRIRPGRRYRVASLAKKHIPRAKRLMRRLIAKARGG